MTPEHRFRAGINRVKIAMPMALLMGLPLAANGQGTPPKKPAVKDLQTPAKKALIKAIKESEREGFKHHNLPGFLQPFAQNFAVTYGRDKAVSSLDYTLDRSQFIRRLKRSWKRALTGHEDVFFSQMTVEKVGGKVLVRTVTSFHFFGGYSKERRAYTLKAHGNEWLIEKIRIWPVSDDLGGHVNQYNAEYWVQRDERLKIEGTKPSMDFIGYLTLLLESHRFKTAYAFAKKTAKAQPTYAEAWKASAALAHKLGFDGEAMRYARKAIALDPSIDVPSVLREPK